MKAISHLFDVIKGSIKSKTFKSYSDKRKIVIEKEKVEIPYSNTAAQQQQRNKFKDGINYWKTLSDQQKQEYEQQAKPHKLTGYQWFMHLWLTGQIITAIWYKITINNSSNSNTLTDYAVLVNITNDTQFFNDCQNDKNHIRCMDGNKQNYLKYYIEEWDTANHNAKIWIKIPSIAASSTTYAYIKIDNNLTTDGQDPQNTFLQFTTYDTLEGVNIVKYPANDPAINAIAENSMMKVTSTATNKHLFSYISTATDNFLVETKCRVTDANGSGKAGVVISAGQSGIDENNCIYMAMNRFSGENWRWRCEKKVNGSWSNVANSGSLTVDTNFHIYALSKNGNTIRAFFEREEKASTTHDYLTNPYPETLTWYIDTYSQIYYYDYLLVRKYQPPEPTTSYQKE